MHRYCHTLLIENKIYRVGDNELAIVKVFQNNSTFFPVFRLWIIMGGLLRRPTDFFVTVKIIFLIMGLELGENSFSLP